METLQVLEACHGLVSTVVFEDAESGLSDILRKSEKMKKAAFYPLGSLYNKGQPACLILRKTYTLKVDC